MRPLKLNSVIPSGTNSQIACIKVMDYKDETICFIYADRTIQPFTQTPFFSEEIETFALIANNFFLFFNNIKTL